MALPMVAPELYRPQVDFPNVPYDHLLRMAADRFPERQAIIYHELVLTYREVVSMANCLAVTHLSPVDPALDRAGSVGLFVHNTEQKVVDQETGDRELPAGEEGEIIVHGPQVMPGYWKAPEETARALRHGWLYTGDIGYVDADGYLYVVDRKKEMIKYKAFSIAPAELEAVLPEHPAVQDAAVIGIPDEQAGEAPKGFVVLRPEQRVTADELITFVNSRLASYKKLHEVEFIDVIPQVPSGKVLRRVLKEREKAARAAPQSEIL